MVIDNEYHRVDLESPRSDITAVAIARCSDIPIEDDYDSGDKEQDKAYFQRFHDGELDNVDIEVRVILKDTDITASEYLGACHVRSCKCGEDILETVKEYDMLTMAIDSLESEILSTQQIINNRRKA